MSFIDSNTEGAAEALDYARNCDWSAITANSGVDRETIEKLCRHHRLFQSERFLRGLWV